jgi:hypothetical protein
VSFRDLNQAFGNKRLYRQIDRKIPPDGSAVLQRPIYPIKARSSTVIIDGLPTRTCLCHQHVCARSH